MPSDAAKVTSIEELTRFRAGLVKTLDELRLAIAEAGTDVGRTRSWVEREQPLYWQVQQRKAQEAVATCKSALFRKQMVTSSKDQKPSVVDEKKALERAQARLALCEHKRAVTKRWAIEITRAEILFKAGLAPIATATERDIPHAIAILARMIQHLEAYVRLEAPDLSRLLKEKGDAIVADMRRSGDDDAASAPGDGAATAPEAGGDEAARPDSESPEASA